MLSLFPRDVLDEILDLIQSVSEGFPTNPCLLLLKGTFINQKVLDPLLIKAVYFYWHSICYCHQYICKTKIKSFLLMNDYSEAMYYPLLFQCEDKPNAKILSCSNCNILIFLRILNIVCKSLQLNQLENSGNN